MDTHGRKGRHRSDRPHWSYWRYRLCGSNWGHRTYRCYRNDRTNWSHRSNG